MHYVPERYKEPVQERQFVLAGPVQDRQDVEHALHTLSTESPYFSIGHVTIH